MKDSILLALIEKWESRIKPGRDAAATTRNILDQEKGFAEGTQTCAIELRALINLLGEK